MQEEEQVEQADEPTAEAQTPAEEAAGGDAGDEDLAAAVDEQAAESSGTAAEQEPEVPDDASATIARAQEHIDNLNMDEEREAAKRAM